MSDLVFNVNKATSGGGGGGGVTYVGSGAGLTGGPITDTGTLSLDTILNQHFLANIEGITAVPSETTLTQFLDVVAGNAQGSLLFRNATDWTALPPGATGDVLVCGGASADPSWEAAGGGSVTQINTGTGLTGGPITTTGTISFATIGNNNLLANISGATAAPTPHTLTSIIDSAISSTQGSILYRNATTWTSLPPGTVGEVLVSGGAAANPSWADVGSGSVTQVNTGAGLTGGPITSTGTISFATVTNNRVLANISGAAAVPSQHTMSDILDSTFTNIQGSLLYRNNAQWSYLVPSTTAGYLLQSNGTGQNPSWVAAATSGYPLVNTYYIASNGNNSNSGTSSSAPKASLLGPSGVLANITDLNANNIIIYLDGYTYPITSTTTISGNITLYAPFASLQALGIDMFLVADNSNLTIIVNNISAGAGHDVVRALNTNSFFKVIANNVVGNVTNLYFKMCELYVQDSMTGDVISGNVTGYGIQGSINNQTGFIYGNYIDVRASLPTTRYTTSQIIGITNTYQGELIVAASSGTGNYSVNLPSWQSSYIAAGSQFYFIQAGNDPFVFSSSDGATINPSSGAGKYTSAGLGTRIVATVVNVGTVTQWNLDGNTVT